METLSEKIVNIYNDYVNADIGKKEYLKGVYDINEQKDDIYSLSKGNAGDFFLNQFIDEIYLKSVDDILDKDDIKYPVDDIEKVLNGTYDYKTYYDYKKPYKVDKLEFCLTDKWNKGKPGTDYDEYTYSSNKEGYVKLFTLFDYSDNDPTMKKDFGTKYILKKINFDKNELKYNDIYKSRNSNYFYTFKGSFKTTNTKETWYANAALLTETLGLGSKNYIFLFTSNKKLSKSKLHEILDHIEYKYDDDLYEADEKYEEYLKND